MVKLQVLGITILSEKSDISNRINTKEFYKKKWYA